MLFRSAPQQQSATATPADGRKRKKREETVAETLRRLWKTKEGRDKILAAGSAEKIAILIGCSKTQVLASGRIWKEEIKSRLKTQRTLDRYHRDEERLDG